MIEESGSEIPLPKPGLTVGIIYNLKKGLHTHVVDAEAEYDNIDTVYAIQKALEAGGVKVELLEADKELPAKLNTTPLDIAFNIAEGFSGRGREAQIPALLNMLGIPFTGSDETTLCIALDKALTKRLLATYHVRTPRYAVLTRGNLHSIDGFKYPVIVKPNAEGSSKGISDISVVETRKALIELAKQNIELYKGDFLAEEYIEGREFTVGLIGNGNEVRVFSPMEILYKGEIPGGYNVYSYPVKQQYERYVAYQCPANLTKEQEAEMVKVSKTIFKVLGCKDFSRIDYRLSPEGKLYFIEINPLPGLAPNYSDYPMLAGYCGVEHGTLVRSILKQALNRYGIQFEVKDTI